MIVTSSWATSRRRVIPGAVVVVAAVAAYDAGQQRMRRPLGPLEPPELG